MAAVLRIAGARVFPKVSGEPPAPGRINETGLFTEDFMWKQGR